MIPHRAPFFLPWLYPSLLWRMPVRTPTLYLTFDDGPMPGPTDYALDVLAEKKARATFFCIGENIVRHPALFRRIMDEGHTVGNHTFNHLNGWRTALDVYRENTARCNAAAQQHGYTQPMLFRPPYGRITRAQIRALGAYRIVMWDVLTRDYERTLTPERCLQGTLRACRPGSIVVLHDSQKAWGNMGYVLPRLIDHFAAQGYAFEAIPVDHRSPSHADVL